MLDDHYTIELPRRPVKKRRPRPKVGDLTLLEVEILRALQRAIGKYDNPSLREIGESSSKIKAPSMVHKYLHRLADKGYVWLPARGRARGVKMLRPVPLQTQERR